MEIPVSQVTITLQLCSARGSVGSVDYIINAFFLGLFPGSMPDI